ncbi:MAG: carbohydrate-binding protein [Lachnospiraceae bacterium]|nr:carbohydrate-binding protein [Lachnospiraceae bacterium]
MKKRVLSFLMAIAMILTVIPYNVNAEALSNIKGKTFFFLGSSVTYGYAANGKSFVEYIAERNQCSYVKEAVSGTTLVDNGSGSYVARMKNNMDKNRHCDHFVCQLSTNDASQNKPLGTLSASKNLNDFDTQTIIGAMEYIVCYAKQTWNCPVTFYTNPRYNNGNYQAMVDALYQVKSKWNIGIIDLWNNQDAINIMNSSQKSVYMADDIHPNAKGYSEWWTPIFENYFQTFNYSSDPIEVFGAVLSSPSDNTVGVVWGQNDAQISSGQKYNIYIDGQKKYSEVGCSYYEVKGIEPGEHTVKITAVLNGKETSGAVGKVVVTGSSQTTTETTTERQVVEYNAFDRIEAENYDEQSGVVKDTNGNASNGFNIGGVNNGDYIQFEKINFSESAAAVSLCYSSKTNDALGNAEIYVDNMNNKVGTVELGNTGTGWSAYSMTTAKLSQNISAGSHRIYIKFVTTGAPVYVCNLDYFQFIKNSEYADPDRVSVTDKLEVNGFQISYISQGIRTVYSAEESIDNQNVEELGLVYAIVNDNYRENDMYIGSDNQYVASYKATNAGKLENALSKNNSYTMTMIFADDKTATNYNKTYAVRVYAKLTNGEYVYSNIETYSIYKIAQKIYDRSLMNTYAAHTYLYNDILKVSNPNYEEVEFVWKNTLAKPNKF